MDLNSQPCLTTRPLISTTVQVEQQSEKCRIRMRGEDCLEATGETTDKKKKTYYGVSTYAAFSPFELNPGVLPLWCASIRQVGTQHGTKEPVA